MGGGGGVIQTVVSGVAVSVKGLGVVGGLDNRIRGEELAQNRIVEPCPVVVEAELVIVFLVGEGVRTLEGRSAGSSGSVAQPFVVQISKNEGNVALPVAHILHRSASMGKILSHRIRK